MAYIASETKCYDNNYVNEYDKNSKIHLISYEDR